MILVIGATGRIGRAVCAGLAARGADWRALVRDPDRAAAAGIARERCRAGDLRRPAALEPLLGGARALFLVTPDAPDQAAVEIAVLERAAAAGLRHVVKVSAYAAGLEPPVGYGASHAEVERHLARGSLSYAVLRPYLFMQVLLEMAGPIGAGRLPLPLGRGEVALVDARDVAAVAVALLVSEEPMRRVYTLTGPEPLSGQGLAAALAAALGHRVRYWPVPRLLARPLLRLAGASAWDARMRSELFGMLAAGGEAAVTGTVAMLAGRPPRTFEAFCREHAPALGGR